MFQPFLCILLSNFWALHLGCLQTLYDQTIVTNFGKIRPDFEKHPAGQVRLNQISGASHVAPIIRK